MKHSDEQISFILDELVGIVDNENFSKNTTLKSISKKVLNKYFKRVENDIFSIKSNKYYDNIIKMEDELFIKFFKKTLISFQLVLATTCILPNNDRQMLFSLYQQLLNKSYYLLEELNYSNKFGNFTIQINLQDLLSNWGFLYLYSSDFLINNYFRSIIYIHDNEDLQKNFYVFSEIRFNNSNIMAFNECNKIMQDYKKHKSAKIVQNQLRLLFCRIKV